jgi:hypothetical protein
MSDELFATGLPTLRQFATAHGVQSALSIWARGKILATQPDSDPTVSFLEMNQCKTAAIVLMAGLNEHDLADARRSAERIEGFPAGDELDRCLAQVRSGKLLIQSDQRPVGDRWMAAPVMGGGGRVVAAVALHTVDAGRPRDQALVTGLGRVATKITDALQRAAASGVSTAPIATVDGAQ